MSYARKRRRTSTSSSTNHRALAQFAGGAGGFLVDGIPGAFQGAALAGQIFDVGTGIMYPEPTIDDAALNVGRLDVTQRKTMGGKYTGLFRKPSFKTKTIEGEYASRGYVQRRESFGATNDPHALYIGHSTYDPEMIAGTVVGALIRKVLAKGGCPVNDRLQELPMSSPALSLGFKLEFYTIQQNGTVEMLDQYVFADNASLSTVITAMGAMQQFFINCLLNNIDADIELKPHMLCLYAEDRYQNDPVLSTSRLAAKLDLGEEIVDLKICSILTIQNRTQGAFEAGTFNAERTDAQPLKGRLYEFRNGDPRLRISNLAQRLMNEVPVDRAILVRSAQLGAEWQDVPPPNYFQNCIKTSTIKMQPGNIKRTVLTYKFSGVVQNMLVKLRASSTQVVSLVNYASRVPGHCQIIGFEEEMRTASNNPIDMAYERQLVVGAGVKTRKKAPLKVGLAIPAAQNNVP